MGEAACTYNAQEITAAMQKAHISFAGERTELSDMENFFYNSYTYGAWISRCRQKMTNHKEKAGHVATAGLN